MILDFAYNKKRRQFNISYITPSGSKALKQFNVMRFKSYALDPEGQFTNWDGRKCSPIYKEGLKWEDWTEPLTFMNELPEHDRADLLGKYNPKLYTWDIETKYDPTEFPDPEHAKFPVTVISVANDKLDVIELGTMDLSKDDQKWVQEQIIAYLNKSEFYKGLGLPTPKFKYVKFDTEEEMIEYFLRNIAAKTPILAGWNSDGFDHYYLQTRMANEFPNLSWRLASPTWTTHNSTYQNMKGTKIRLQKPDHTLVVDMMDIIGSFDMTLDKESLALDAIAKQCAGIGKIEYKGDLEHLRQTDYRRYVFYSCIDSILVQLIDKKCKTMQILAAQALYCRTKIEAAKSKIAVTEALFFNYWFDNGIKIVPPEPFQGERGTLIGAYVRQPTPGKHKWSACLDFASLYPSVIITCNLSVENYVGCLDDGDFTEEFMEQCKKDPNYFVTVNRCIFKNDKDYAFKIIQQTLKSNRNIAKYCAKNMDATVMADIEHIMHNRPVSTTPYPENVVKQLQDIGLDIKSSKDLQGKNINDLARIVKNEIEWLNAWQLAQKLLGNSGYGGSSHVAFAFFNIRLANSITLSGQELIHLMEAHIPEYFQKNWFEMTDLHKKLGVKIKSELNEMLVEPVAGDTDSCFFKYENILKTLVNEDGTELTDKDKLRVVVGIHEQFLNEHNRQFMEDFYKVRHARDMVHEFELEKISFSEVRLDVKKRYAQLLCWVDGKVYDFDELCFKSKGLEMVKASYPKLARNGLKRIVRVLLESDETGIPLTHKLNKVLNEEREKWKSCPVEDVCENKGVSNYTKYIASDDDPEGVQVELKCPYHVRALANRNWTINTKGIRAELQYGGKMKIYIVKNPKPKQAQCFAFMAGEWEDWMEKYWPVDRMACFQKFFLDPINRILKAINERELNIDGRVDLNLFDLL